MAQWLSNYEVSFLRRKEIILQMTKFNGLVLDIGCSIGAFSDELARQGAEPVGIDISSPAVKLANIHVGDFFFLCDGTELPFRNECFEAVTCADVLEHVKNDWKIIQEISRILKSGGKAVFTVPMIRKGRISDKDLKWADRWRHVRVGYTVWDMVTLLRRNGLKTIKMREFSCHFSFTKLLWHIGDKLVWKWKLQELLSIDKDTDIEMLELEAVRKLSGKLSIKLYICLFQILDGLLKLGDALFPKSMKDHLAILAIKEEE